MDDIVCFTCFTDLNIDYFEDFVVCPECGEMFDVIWPGDDAEPDELPVLEYH